jgi:hypothetical protein
VQHRVGSLVVMPDPFLIDQSEQLVALAARHAMPAIYPTRTSDELRKQRARSRSAGRDLRRKDSQGRQAG